MNENFRFPALPWLNNAGNTFNAAVQDFVGGLVHPPEEAAGQRGFFPRRTQQQQRQQQQQQEQHQQQQQHNFNTQNGGNQGAPPASMRAIRKLPTIRVSPEDLVEPSNRECCICLEENCLDDKVMRLPCAHIFHEDCVVDWLINHHCTCPVCRFELPTDNPLYEAGRLERMKTRKPRYAMYELKRMSVPELLALNKRPPPGVIEKDDLIEVLIREERIQVVPAPEPVEYNLEKLKRMKIRELRRAMEDAGVFFHSKDVVEKSDMLTIFLNSGRISLLPSENDAPVASDWNEEAKSEPDSTDVSKERISLPADRPLVETVEEDSDDENDHEVDDFTLPPQEMFPSQGSSSLAFREPAVDGADPAYAASPARESDVDLDQLATVESTEDAIDDSNQDAALLTEMEAPEDMSENTNKNVDTSSGAVESIPSIPANDPSFIPTVSGEATMRPCASNTGAELSSQNPLNQSAHSSADLQYESHHPCSFQEFSISHLQELAKINSIDVSSCFERSEMVNLLINARITMKHPSEILRENLSNFTVSELRVLASEVNIDLAQCNDKEEMLHCIVVEAMTERPHLQSYLRALSPLSKLSLNELRRTAREWGVNINDCLEKGEIMQRLITRGHQFGSI